MLYSLTVSIMQEELLDGDNAYDTEKYGKQPARKGVRFCVNKLDQSQSLNGLFQKFPPVLMIHLKRFEYEYQLDRNVKVRFKHMIYHGLTNCVRYAMVTNISLKLTCRNIWRILQKSPRNTTCTVCWYIVVLVQPQVIITRF